MSMTDTIFGRWDFAVADDVYIGNIMITHSIGTRKTVKTSRLTIDLSSSNNKV
jgi:hypothetical protein